MTHHEIRELEDGTRVYHGGHSYRPVPDGERRYGRRRPADPAAVRFHGQWFVPLALLDDAQRVMPATRPDAETLEHSAVCRCEVCSRPQATEQWRRRARRKQRGSWREGS